MYTFSIVLLLILIGFSDCLNTVHNATNRIRRVRSRVGYQNATVNGVVDTRYRRTSNCDTSHVEDHILSRLEPTLLRIDTEVRDLHRRIDAIERHTNEVQTTLKSVPEIGRELQLALVALRQIHQSGNRRYSTTNGGAVKSSFAGEAKTQSRNTGGCASRNESGVYATHAESGGFLVLCEADALGTGGWTVIQNRYDGSQNFDRDWRSYVNGFGNLAGEFWLGLEKIHQISGLAVNELLVEFVDESSVRYLAHYAGFSVGGESEGYPLKLLGGYGGNAGDSLKSNAGLMFTTKDRDNDQWTVGNCALAEGGGWWFSDCGKTNMNGKFLTTKSENSVNNDSKNQGIHWGEKHRLRQVRLMIRPAQ